ncbi:MAG: HEAT repeat domain-containing protein [Methanolinea sp.]|nr:HEAT repeat domain-containing protein [Methanolinea sp.]
MRFPPLHALRDGRARPAVLAVLVSLAVALELVAHVLLRMETVYTHFFYIPIVLAAVWYGVRGITVGLLLSALYIGDTYALSGMVGVDPAARAGMFVAVSLVVGLVSCTMRGSHGRPGDRGSLLARFSGPDPARMRDEGDVAGLLSALGHPDPAVQYAAAEALGELGEPSAVPALVEALAGDRHPGVRWEAAEALARIGAPAVDALVGILHHPDEDVRWKAAIALGEIGDERAIPPLIELLGDPDRFVQSRAAYALGEFGRRATPLLRLALAQGNPRVRKGAITALREIRDPDALDDLQRALSDPDRAVVSAALDALMHHGEEGYRRIIHSLSSASPGAREEIAGALREVPNQRLLRGFEPLLAGAGEETREIILSVTGPGEREKQGDGGESRPGA